MEECAKVFFSGKEDTVNCYIADATGFSFGDKYNLNWQRGTRVRTVKSHVRLEVVIAVDNKGRRIITGCETGGSYASEIEMLRKNLNSIERLKKVPFIADKGYDAVDIIGFVPAVKVKETFRTKVSHAKGVVSEPH